MERVLGDKSPSHVSNTVYSKLEAGLLAPSSEFRESSLHMVLQLGGPLSFVISVPSVAGTSTAVSCLSSSDSPGLPSASSLLMVFSSSAGQN